MTLACICHPIRGREHIGKLLWCTASMAICYGAQPVRQYFYHAVMTIIMVVISLLLHTEGRVPWTIAFHAFHCFQKHFTLDPALYPTQSHMKQVGEKSFPGSQNGRNYICALPSSFENDQGDRHTPSCLHLQLVHSLVPVDASQVLQVPLPLHLRFGHPVSYPHSVRPPVYLNHILSLHLGVFRRSHKVNMVSHWRRKE